MLPLSGSPLCAVHGKGDKERKVGKEEEGRGKRGRVEGLDRKPKGIKVREREEERGREGSGRGREYECHSAHKT